jgi:hypothetical protein
MASDPAWRSRALTVSTATFVVAVAVLAPVLIANVSSSTQLTELSHTGWWWLLTQVTSLPAICASAMLVVLTVSLRRRTGRTRTPSLHRTQEPALSVP